MKLRAIVASLLVAIAATGAVSLATLPVAVAADQATMGRDPFLWPFDAESSWNTPIGSDATYSGRRSRVTSNLTDPRYQIWVNADEYSHPMYRASKRDPRVDVPFTYANVAPFEDGSVTYRIPAKARAAEGTDRHLHVLDPDGVTLHETWDFRRAGRNEASAGKYAATDLCGSGLSPRDDLNYGARAYGGSAVGGLIRTWELRAGVIRHALAVALANDQLEQGWVWPASSEDSTAGLYAGTIPMGSLVAIPGGVRLGDLGLSRRGRVFARALQDYGAYVVDRAPDVVFSAEPGAERLLGPIREDLDEIRSELRVVTNNGPASVGGGGAPGAATAPRLEGCL